ncbi:MAG TPA: ABC transporter permease [Clostridiales bacterium]|nr:ABC transporter permease [Clostridiales bacterium]
MKICSLLALRSLIKNKLRTTTTSVGIFLAVLLMSAIAVLVTSVISSLAAAEINEHGDWHFYVSKAADTQINDVFNTKKVAKYCTASNLGISNIANPIDKDKTSIQLTAVSPSFFEMMPVKLIEGKLPKSENEILVPAHLKNDYKFKVGGYITLNLIKQPKEKDPIGDGLVQTTSFFGLDTEDIGDEERKTYLIVGVCEVLDMMEITYYSSYAVLTLDITKGFQEKAVYFKLKNPRANYYKITDNFSIDSVIPNFHLLDVLGIGMGESVGKALEVVAIFLILIIALASYALINSSFMISVSEKIRYYGLLFLTGATKGQIIKTVLFEALFLSIIIIPLGIACGIGVMFLSLNSIAKIIVSASYVDLIFRLDVNIFSLLIIAAFSIILAVISSIGPALKSAKKTVISAIRQSDDIYIKKKRKPKKPRHIKYRHIKSIESGLVLKNFSRFRKKYRSIAFCLVLSMVLFVSASTLCAYADVWINESAQFLDYDIICNASYEDFFQTIDTVYLPISKLNGIDEAGWFASMEAGFLPIDYEKISEKAANYYQEKNTGIEMFNYIFMDDVRFSVLAAQLDKDLSLYTDKNNLRVITLAALEIYHKDKDKIEMIQIFEQESIELNLRYMSQADWEEYWQDYFESDEPNFDENNYLNYGQNISVVADVYSRYYNLPMELSILKEAVGAHMIIPISMLEEFSQDRPQTVRMFFKAKNHKDVFYKIKTLADENNWDVYFEDVAIYYEFQKNLVTTVDVFSRIFILLVATILALNVFNTIISNMLIRNREFAILRSVGMSRRSYYKIIFYECAFYSLISITIGVVLSVLVSLLLKDSFGIPMAFILPVKEIIFTALAIGVILTISTLFAARKILSNNIIESIKTEIT